MVEKDRKSDFNLRLGIAQTESLKVRGIPTGPILKRSAAQEYLRSVTWARVLMAWNENDLNIAWHDPDDRIERWEGLIAAPSTEAGFYMSQIGGPNCGPFNKRYELVLRPAGPNEFYFNPADHRVHIKHSNKTWLKVDYDGDRKVDMDYRWIDCNGDGIMDRIEVDVDGEGTVDDAWDLDVAGVRPVRWTFEGLSGAYAPVLANEPSNKYNLVVALTAALESFKKGAGQEPILDFIGKSMRGGHFHDDIAQRLIDSDEAMLYYLMLVVDRQIAKLKKIGCGGIEKTGGAVISGSIESVVQNNGSCISGNIGRVVFWRTFNTARSAGDTKAMTNAVMKEFNLNFQTDDYASWVSRLRK